MSRRRWTVGEGGGEGRGFASRVALAGCALACVLVLARWPGAGPAEGEVDPAGPLTAAERATSAGAPVPVRLALAGLSAETSGSAAPESTSQDDQGGGEAGQEPGTAHAEGEGQGGGAHGLPYAEIFLVLISILLLGKLFGEIAERLGQPAVLGELLAGVALGASVLGVIPEAGTTVGDIVRVFAEIGVVILLFEIGLETDLKEMFRVGTSATAVALVGIVLPFGLGFLYWYYFDPSIGTHPAGITFWIVAIFVGATLTATSVGITARVLSDLDQMHTSEARIIIGAAVIDDVLGIVILAVVAGLAGGAAMSAVGVGRIFLFAVGYLVLAVWIGNKAAPALFNMVDRMRVRGVLLVAAFCFALLLAALAAVSGSAMIIGAFAAGIVLSSTNQFDTVVQRIEPVADIFTPIFFVVVGAPVNVDLFIPGTADFDVNVLVVGLVLTVIAIVGKVLAGWATRRGELNRLAIGVGMIPRGEVGLIFASIGLTGGILSRPVYSAILIMVILSTFVVPPFLKVIFARRGGTVPAAAGEEGRAQAAAAATGEDLGEGGLSGVSEGRREDAGEGEEGEGS